jgi:hypothetical protein
MTAVPPHLIELFQQEAAAPGPTRASYPDSVYDAESAYPGSMPQPSSRIARAGLAYQRRVGRALAATAERLGGSFDPEPWFRWKAGAGDSWRLAVPDGLFTFGDLQLVIEVKLSFVPDAPEKLAKLYVPVVERARRLRVRPLVITRALRPEAVGHPFVETLSEAARLPAGVPVPILLYLGSGQILWTARPSLRMEIHHDRR